MQARPTKKNCEANRMLHGLKKENIVKSVGSGVSISVERVMDTLQLYN